MRTVLHLGKKRYSVSCTSDMNLQTTFQLIREKILVSLGRTRQSLSESTRMDRDYLFLEVPVFNHFKSTADSGDHFEVTF